MPKTREIRKLTKKEWAGIRWDNNPLLDWLNKTKDSAERQRVIGILRGIQRAMKLTAVIDFDFAINSAPQDCTVERSVPLDRYERDFDKLRNEINASLRRYTFSPSVNTLVSKSAWHVWWNPLGDSEAAAVGHLLLVAQMGDIDLIGQCRSCGLWFSGKRGAVSCSNKCRQKAYDKSANGKLKKAVSMKAFMRRKRAKEKKAS